MNGKQADKWQWLVMFIPTGEREAVSMSHLARTLAVSQRELRRSIEQARRAGNLICSSEKGYFIPETLDELKAYAHRTRERARTNRACLAPFLRRIRQAERG